MKILLIEDASPIAHRTSVALRKKEHTVIESLGIPGAIDQWEKGEASSSSFDCIILDLNLPWPREWTRESAFEPLGRRLAGWVWFKDWLLPKAPAMRQRTVVYSGYLNDLFEKVDPEEWKGIRMVPKSPGGARKLMEHIQQLGEMGPRAAQK